MPRIRTIKPDFWTDETVTACSLSARLLFIGLWNFADDDGRLEDAPRQIKMRIFPGDDFTADAIDGWLAELAGGGLIRRYAVDGRRYMQITGWHHQVINRRTPSKIPAPRDEDSVTPPAGTEGNGRNGGSPSEGSCEPSEEAPALDRKPARAPAWQRLRARCLAANGGDEALADALVDGFTRGEPDALTEARRLGVRGPPKKRGP